MKTKNLTLIALAILTVSLGRSFGQSAPQFTRINAEPDNSIQLHWTSNTNEFYGIQYANALATNADGSTAWQTLYDNYPSQGTNTFWLDDGNFILTPNVPVPNNSMARFYRILVEGTNTPDDLTVSISNITNGAVLSGNITVSVIASSSSNAVSSPILYLDGKETPPSSDGTNFTINTCSSWNGSHSLFAVAKSQSGLEGANYQFGISYNRAVSPMVNVTFGNLITEFAFSKPFIFQPSIGQTQEVSASFTANCNWMLQILNASSNTVRTVTGSGDSMSFLWDGTGDGETNIADGIYTYLISASTNGLASEVVTNGGGTIDTNSPPSPSEEEVYVVNSANVVTPLAIYPPSIDTNGMTLVTGTPSEVRSFQSESFLRHSFFSSSLSVHGGTYFTPMDAGSSGSSQSSSSSGAKNALGTIGVCYQEFLNTNILTKNPVSGYPYGIGKYYVGIDGGGYSDSSSGRFGTVTQTKQIADGFAKGMQKAGYYGAGSFEYGDDQVKINDLKKTSEGGNSIFNNVNLGFLITHGSYGSTAESDGVKYTYTWIENIAANNIQDLRLSDFDFGGSDPTNGLRWMTVFTCDTLFPSCYNSMKTHSKLPINNYLHLLLSDNTVIWFAPDIGKNYAINLTDNGDTLIDSWNGAGQTTYARQNKGITNNVVFTYVGYPACTADKLDLYESPDTGDGLMTGSTTVYTLP